MAFESKQRADPFSLPEENHFRREAILEAVSYSADRFLRSGSWTDCIGDVLERLGQAADATCAYLFEHHDGQDGQSVASLRHHWLAPGFKLKNPLSAFQNLSLTSPDMSFLLARLEDDRPFYGSTEGLSKRGREVLSREGIRSFVIVPVVDEVRRWGFMGFDERRRRRDWTAEEGEALRAAANILSAAIANERIKTRLTMSEAELRSIFTAMRHTVYVVSAERRFVRVVPTNPDLLLQPAEQMLGRTLAEVLPSGLAADFEGWVGQVLSTGQPAHAEYFLSVGSPPRDTWFTSILSPFTEGSVLIVSHDISERKKTEAAVEQSEARYRRLFENLLESVFQTGPTGQIVSANPAMVRLLGYDSEAELLAANAGDTYFNADDQKTWVERMSKDGEIRNFEVTLRRRDGTAIPVLLNARAIRGGRDGLLSYEGTITDITDRKRLEAQLIILANRDPLTNLFNRRRFQEELELQLTQSKRYGMASALLWLDVDRFKEINDTMGHRYGDELLVELARLLEGLLRGHDVLARLGGDEFAILMPHVDALQAQTVAARLIEAVHRHNFEIGDHPLRITASIGIALFPEHATSADNLLVHADLAMYRAKEEGRNRFSFYKLQEDRSERLGFRVEWIKNIRRALDNDQLVLFAQPILDLRTNSVSQHELLLRMERPAGGSLIPPETFLDVAVKFNLIQEIDHWVVRQAIRVIRDQAGAGRSPVIEINLSAKAFDDLDLLTLLENELSAIDPSRLIVEVTEISALTDFPHAQRFIVTLKKLGCRCALDDFGVGLTSFQHLKHLPLDFLKIDGSLIQDLAHNAVNQHIVQAIVNLTRGLGIKTVAECVDSPETMRLLKEYEVDYAQGFKIGEPRALKSLFG
jgi:diguanylate cyclase (GGDEF)-like protein/PAS domain S-box-containing protein